MERVNFYLTLRKGVPMNRGHPVIGREERRLNFKKGERRGKEPLM